MGRVRILVTIAVVVGGVLMAVPAEAASRNFYVDCAGGADSNSGRTPAEAFRSLTRASQVNLRPGDRVLLKRDCTWSGGQRLDLTSSGTQTNPIVVGNYGYGSLPKIKDGKNQGIKVTGSYILIKKVHITFGVHETKTVMGCVQPVGDYYGVNMTGGAHHVTLKNSIIENANAGVHLSKRSHHITVARNTLRNNNVMNVFGGDPARDLGAWGILVRSDNNEIKHNVLRDNRAKCPNSAGRIHSNSIEIFEGANNYVHHNKSFNDRVFSELGGSSSKRASDNTFEFNLHRSSMVDARFVTTRGGQSSWGPVWRTRLEHNTVVLTGEGSVGVSCGRGCNSSVLTARGNILWAEKSVFADAGFDEADNLYWNSRGPTNIQVANSNRFYDRGTSVLNGSVVANPTLKNVGAGNFRPDANSPAHNRADSSSPQSNVDLGRRTGVINGHRDSGAYETG